MVTGRVKSNSQTDTEQRSVPAAASMVCTHFPTFENLVCGSNISGTRRTDTPVGYGSVVAHMARGHLQVATVHLATTGEGRRIGLGRSVEQMLNHVSDSM